MQMVIDIPEEVKKAFDCAESNDLKGGYYDHGGVVGIAIKNGTPLKKGHWIEDEVYEELYTCSECGCKLEDEQTYISRNFCPNCGTDMRDD